MSRDWAAIYTAMITRPKYRRLSIPARAALFHVWLLAGSQDPEATWTDREDLVDALDLDGYPAGVIDELIERRWLDLDDRGRVVVHDWDQHQLAATTSARRAYESDRKREWRRQRPLSLPPGPPSQEKGSTTPTPQDITRQDTTTQVSPIVRDVSPIVRDTSGSRPAHTEDDRPVSEDLAGAPWNRRAAS